jgi:uncharacterized protein YdcH (DUF465 family)
MDLTRRVSAGHSSAESIGNTPPLPLDLPERVGPPAVAGPVPARPDPAAAFTKLQTKVLTLTKPEIVPMDLHHPILREFPQYREVIRRLKGSNDHFRSLFEEYHRLDDEIYRIEEEIEFATDQETEELKMRRAKLKDYIYHIIRHAPPVCPACAGTGFA